MQVAAAFTKTWNAVIDQFAEDNIPISTMERESGFIATSNLRVGADGFFWAECGKTMGAPITPAYATYNVVVRGDSARSTVRVSARWTTSDGGPCSTTGKWEAAIEADVRDRAEGRAPSRSTSAPEGPKAPPRYAHTTERARLMRSASEGSELLDIIPANGQVIVLSEREWLYVAWAALRGFIKPSQVKFDK